MPFDDPPDDPGALVETWASCGAPMDERKYRLIGRCGCFLSCPDYYESSGRATPADHPLAR